MKNLIEKFERENEALIANYLLAKKDNDIKSKKRLIIVGGGGAVLIVTIGCLLQYVAGKSQNAQITITLILMVPWFFLTIASFAVIPKKLRSMYADLNSKAKESIKHEILPKLLLSLKKDFILNENFEKNLIGLIENQENWIGSGTLISYQRIDSENLLMTKDKITYYLFSWSYTGDGFEIKYAPNFGWMEAKLLIEDSGDYILTNK